MARPAQKVSQLEWTTGKVIAIYNSVSEASEENGLISDTPIRKAFIRKTDTLNKYKLRFRYYKDGDELEMARHKKIRQVDYYTGEEIEVYNSITEAAWDNWLCYETLSDALRKCNGMINSKKLRFEYA